MQAKSDHRATRPNDRSITGPKMPVPTRIRPDQAPSHGRDMQRGIAPRRLAAHMQAQTGASMDYQLGFTSGPSS
jgi:hypothetical protein